MRKPRLLLVDDDPAIRFAVRDFFDTAGFETVEADSCRAARDAIHRGSLDAVVLDYRLPDGTSLDLIPEIRRADLAVVVLTGHGSIDLAVEAVKAGADHFMTKPVQLPALQVMLERVIAGRRARKRDTAARIVTEPHDPFLGSSPLIHKLRDQARRLAAADTPVLLQGETGSGKGVLARWLHDNGSRSEEAFVDLNCAGLSREFLESELFGHERGAFTGAVAAKQGLLEVAEQGSLFLDEIGDMDAAVQAKLLKVIEEKRFRRLGDVRDRHVDMRLICATHRDLLKYVGDDRFRADLYYRVSAFPLLVPPLRARRDDIPELARHFASRISRDLGRPHPRISDDAIGALQSYSWPGNIRELRNVIERALLLTDSADVAADSLHFDGDATARDGAGSLAEVERAHILMVVEEEGGHVDRAAARLGIGRSSLYQKLRAYGVNAPRSQ